MTETTCERIERLISRALDGEATDAERAEASAHAEGCAGCRETERAWRRLGDAFGASVGGDEPNAPAVVARPSRPVPATRAPTAGGDARAGLAVGVLIAARLVAVAALAGAVGSGERGELARQPAETAPIETSPAPRVGDAPAPEPDRLRVRLAPARPVEDDGAAPREVEVALAARIEVTGGRLVLNLRR